MDWNIQDGLNLMSKVSIKRARNAAGVLSDYYRSKLTGKPQLSHFPISVSVEPTTACNLRCPECPSGLRSFTRPTGKLSSELFQNIVKELTPTLSYLIFYFQGEPYLHPQLLEMIRVASQKNIYTATSTNAHYLSEENARKTIESGLDRLIISIDGVSQESYESYRIGGNLSKVLEGASNVVAWKKKLKSKTPHIIFQFLVVRQNESEIDQLYSLSKKVGVDEVALKTAQIYDFKNGSDLIPVQEKYSRYKVSPDGTYRIKNQLLNHCWKMWHSCVITWDGKVVPCCFDKDAQHVLGDLNQQSFEEIWFGPSYQQFRQSLLQARSEIEICKNCTEGTKVWA